MVLHAAHLCAGYGGFDLALGRDARTVVYVERDAYAAATLVARMEAAQLDQAPVWSDLCTFDAAAWRGRVDLVTAGFPCQPFSAAGKRMGIDDDRWLWPAIAAIVRDVEPRYVFLENVPGVVRAGLAHVLGDLAELGFDAEWGLLSAAAIGAPHRRERFWLVAYRADGECEPAIAERQVAVQHDVGRSGSHVAEPAGAGLQGAGVRGYEPAERCGDVADGHGGRRHADIGDDGRREHDAARCCTHVGNAQGVGCCPRQRSGADELSGRRAHLEIAEHRFPPRPDDHDGWQRWEGAQPAIRRGADGAPEWLADALHLGGNGLVPQCAREAWRQLTERLRT